MITEGLRTQTAPAIRSTWRGPFVFNYVHEEEFEKVYTDLFVDQVYRFDARTKSPRILDCGAHIGVSVMYFKHLYPDSVITAFEPNPSTFELLKRNVTQNRLSGVTLINAAISDVPAQIPFYRHRDPAFYHWGDSLVKMSWYNPTDYETLQVPAYALSSYLSVPLDFLKLDIEGFEQQVLEGTALNKIRQMVVEYHGVIGDNLDGFLQVFKNAGFGTAIRQGSEITRRRDVVPKNPYTLLVYGHRSLPRLCWQLRADIKARVRRKLKL
jgi:FkbM family methyltransferase